MLSFYLSVMETEEAVGIACNPLYWNSEEKDLFELNSIIENYKEHTEEELDQFKKLYFGENSYDYLYPEVNSNIFVVSTSETFRGGKKFPDIYEGVTSVIGITKDNGFVFPGAAGSGYSNTYKLEFSKEAMEYLNSLSLEEREDYLLNLYMSIMETEGTLEIYVDVLYFTTMAGDINGDNKINAADNIAIINFLTGKNSGVLTYNCDLDNNGKINAKDNFYLKQLIVGK